MNTNCYRFEKFIFQKGLLDNCVDATYIIHLEDNGRFEEILNQLDEYHPTKLTYIVFNKGYKNCEKEDYINIPPYDLVDAFLKVFKHANQNNYNNILILEDDFIFHEDIKKNSIQKDICSFIKKQKNKNFIYLLGCVPQLLMPFYNNHYIILSSGGMHSCIYSKQNRIEILKVNQKKIKYWDDFNRIYSIKYTYYKPLCYQLFPETENSKHWFINYKHWKFILNFFNLNNSPEPGYSSLYLLSKILFYLLIFFLILLIYLIYKYLI